VRDPSTGFILTGNGTNSNLGVLKTAGEDIQLDWSFGLGAIGFDDHLGRIAVNSVITHLDADQRNDVPGSPLADFAGSIGGLTNNSGAGGAFPEWKALTSITATHGPFDLTLRWQYIDSMKDASLVGAPAGTVAISPPAINYFDLFGAYRVNDTWEIRAGVNNIADKQPPFFNSATQANTDPSTYDVLGRRWFLALKARF
jgi:iron complex outermembrane receptor protein